ncbi:MAG: GyrI-like domain-containing protein [Vagococcus sp.]
MAKNNREQEEIYLRLINQSEDYIEQHLSEAISLADLAQHANFSEFHFHRLFKELFKFGTKNELINPDVTKVLTMYNDNPFITKDENLRTSIAMTVPNDVEIVESGNVCVSSISGKFGVGHFNISAKEYEQAWHYMYQKWLFKDESQIRDAVPFELYMTEPAKNMTDKSLTDIYIPIN